MILLPHFDIPYGFGLGKIPYDLPFQGPVFFGLSQYWVEEPRNGVFNYVCLLVLCLYLPSS